MMKLPFHTHSLLGLVWWLPVALSLLVAMIRKGRKTRLITWRK